MDVSTFLLANLLNALLGLALFPFGALAVVLVLHILVKLTPWRMKDVFIEGVSGGAIIVCSVLLGLCIILAAAAF